ncbi:50S ribosomal protein L5 [archaeon]|jgi:large subunit ribosomal protein L5|nr:50S ribosomal protein L5 [archaeon]MBT3578261.1 50S ribosomal protein L5 [archaeon]MBT7025600.1 50S ribosomal protein L5 [archaeon]MBT7239108.1 50S ribosomal protein L5 [archaeon]MBT7567533.1 50S ribosomal protein L5 [archaeon]
MEQEMAKPKLNNNKMREVKLEKVILNIGGTGEKLDKGFILLQKLSGKSPVRVKATKRIPTWSVRPGMEVGTKVTLRGADALEMLKKLLPAIDNTLKEKQIQNNFLSFGIHEYIEIPGMEYIREVGIMGLEITAVFTRPGKSVEKKKVKRGKTRRLVVTSQEIIDYLVTKFKTTVLMKRKKGQAETEDDSE